MSTPKRYTLTRVGAGPGAAVFTCENLLGAEVQVVDVADYDALAAAAKVAHQALLEVSHAQDVGSSWYTRGAAGLYNQVAMWVRKGLGALAAVGVR